jgi:ketosteroid isomerase-like protein
MSDQREARHSIARTLAADEAPDATDANVELLLDVFRAVEERNAEALFALFHADIGFHQPTSLPFGGSYYGLAAVLHHARSWHRAWIPFQRQPERRMEPRVVATANDEVVILWQQRG